MAKQKTKNNQLHSKVLFGVRLPNSGPLASPKAIESTARLAESLEYNSVWVHDHIVWNRRLHREHVSSGSIEALRQDQNPDFYESITTLSHLSGLTSNVKLGIAVITAPTHNPVFTAKQLANLDVLSNGRLIVGVGTGADVTSALVDFPVFKVRGEDRQEMTDEFIRSMKEIWTKPVASFSGKFVNFKEIEIFPKPVQKPHPPIFIGGGGTAKFRRTLRRVAELGDGWNPAWLTPQEFVERIGILKEMANRSNRGEKDFEIADEIFANIADSTEKAMKSAKSTIDSNKHTYERIQTSEEILAKSLVGSPDQIIKQIEAFVAAGVRHFELRFIYPTVEDLHSMVKRFEREVIPSFR
ncbi:MAG: LLM class flavin-dependent oxidoreductase [Nitrososphaerales archaeon]